MKLTGVVIATITLLSFGGCSSTQLPVASTASSAQPTSQGTDGNSVPVSADTTPTKQPSSQAPVRKKLIFKIIGTCTTQGGILTSRASGFVPNGEYRTTATYPDGTAYPEELIANPGKASQTGSTPNWKWPCAGDPPGKYKITIKDIATNRSISVTVMVNKP